MFSGNHEQGRQVQVEKGLVGDWVRGVFPEHRSMDEERRREISRMGMQKLMVSQRATATFDSVRQEFIDEVLPTLAEQNPHLVLWETAQTFRSRCESFIAHVSADDWNIMSSPVVELLKGLQEPLYRTTTWIMDKGYAGSELFMPMGFLGHKLTNRTGAVNGLLRSAKRRGDPQILAKASNRLDELINYLSQYGDMHCQEMEAAAIGLADAKSYSSLPELFLDLFHQQNPGIGKMVLVNPMKFKPCETFVNGNAIVRIADELLVNAAKYSGIPVQEMAFFAWADIGEDGYFRMVVGNSGGGFEPSMLGESEVSGKQRLFESGVTTAGTGIGLAEAWLWAVDEMGGSIRAVDAGDAPFGARAVLIFEIPLKLE